MGENDEVRGMKPEVGKRYVTSGGHVTAPLISCHSIRGFCTEERLDGYYAMWEEDGTADFFGLKSSQWDRQNEPYHLKHEVTEMEFWRVPEVDEEPPEAMVEWLNQPKFNGQWEGDECGIFLYSLDDSALPGEYIMELDGKLHRVMRNNVRLGERTRDGMCLAVVSRENETIYCELRNPKWPFQD